MSDDDAPLPLKRGHSGGSGWGGDEDAGDWGDGDKADGGDDWGDFTAQEDTQQLVDQIPKEIKERVQSDLKELQFLEKYHGSPPNWGGGTKITLRVGFAVAILGLEQEQARAWALDSEKMIVIQLEMPPHYWNSRHSNIQVQVRQAKDIDDDLEGFALGWTLEKRIKDDFFKALPPAMVDPPYKLSDVEEVMDITGVDFCLAMQVLQDNKGEVSAAVAQLTSKKTELKRTQSKQEEKIAQSEQKEHAPAAVRQLLRVYPDITAEMAHLALELETSVDKATLLMSNEEARENLREIINQRGLEKPSLKRTVSTPGQRLLKTTLLKHNWLVKLVAFVETKLQTVHKNCLICGGELPYVGLKPSICDAALCRMGFEELGLAFDLGSLIRRQGEVVDLLLSMAFTSASAQKMLFVTPVYLRVTDKDGVEHTFLKEGFKDAIVDESLPQQQREEELHQRLDQEKVRAVLAMCPSVKEMREFAEQGVLEEKLKAVHVLLFPLLRWILTSARSHLRFLTPEEQVPDFGTPWQFVLLSSSPEKEATFQQLTMAAAKDRGGVGAVHAFHGSSTSNWHSILRTGLRNMSNTKYMSTGAAYGPGIYMALDSGTSLGYSRNDAGWAPSMFSNERGSNVRLLAVCEVVNHRDLKPPAPYYVVPQESWVTTRFVMVYPSGTQCNLQIKDLVPKLPKIK